MNEGPRLPDCGEDFNTGVTGVTEATLVIHRLVPISVGDAFNVVSQTSHVEIDEKPSRHLA